MRITIISRSWPSDEHSGVALCAGLHAKILMAQGHQVSIIGAYSLKEIDLAVEHKITVPSSGSGALYSPVKIEKVTLEKAFEVTNPELVVIEAWQTALTDSAIEVASGLHLPILMISHGISMHPYNSSWKQRLRSWAWKPYQYFKLPKLLKKVTAITTLDQISTSPRFYDRELAKKLHIPLYLLRNSPIHWSEKFYARAKRKPQILVVGYFSPVKNQLAAIQLLASLLPEIHLCFIGDRQGAYFHQCEQAVHRHNLDERVHFLQDNECDLGQELASSLLVFLPSITEALPMILIESMACGTPFVANPVGAVVSFKGGITADTAQAQLLAVKRLVNDEPLWQRYSEAGLSQYKDEFTESGVGRQLANAIEAASRVNRSSQ
ncbi:glycosyltransferase family 4 protein [Polynucleobacter paneuropaeus]|nr:glycosyltransferase family 4 protein [Polynucleobacter paneuropaeus]